MHRAHPLDTGLFRISGLALACAAGTWPLHGVGRGNRTAPLKQAGSGAEVSDFERKCYSRWGKGEKKEKRKREREGWITGQMTLREKKKEKKESVKKGAQMEKKKR